MKIYRNSSAIVPAKFLKEMTEWAYAAAPTSGSTSSVTSHGLGFNASQPEAGHFFKTGKLEMT